MTGSDAVSENDGEATAVRRVRRFLIVVVPVTALVLPGLLALAGGARWWHYIAAEQTPMTWFQSVVLVLAGGVCLVLALTVRLGPAASRAGAGRTWLALGLALWVLALDERFAVHERVRDRVLAPRDVRLPLATWIGPGDFLLLGVAVIGLLVLPRVLTGLRPDRAALRVFVLGVVLAAVAVGMDSVDPDRLGLTAERWEQTLEECVELTAGLCFLAALSLRLVGVLGRAQTSAAVDPAVDPMVVDPMAIEPRAGSGAGDVRQIPVDGQVPRGG